MLKIKSGLIIFLLLPLLLYSQEDMLEEKIDDPEKIPEGINDEGTIASNLAQTALNNWASGGQNSIAVSGAVNWIVQYKSGENVLINILDMRYGMVKQGDRDEFIKTDDLLEFTSKYGREAISGWYYSGLLNFKTQMDIGKGGENNTKISAPFAPAYLTTALGMDWNKYKSFSLFLSPITSKWTFVLDDTLASQGAFGVELGQNTRHEIGGYLRAQYRKEIMKNITIDNQLTIFGNYVKVWKNIDYKYDLRINLRVNEYISTTITATAKYDNDINTQGEVLGLSGLQVKESIGVGFAYNF